MVMGANQLILINVSNHTRKITARNKGPNLNDIIHFTHIHVAVMIY